MITILAIVCDWGNFQGSKCKKEKNYPATDTYFKATESMKYVIITFVHMVQLCAALFVILDAAPVLPASSYDTEFESIGRQQSDEMTKIFLNVFSKPFLTAAGNGIDKVGSIQWDGYSKVWQTIQFETDLLNSTSNFLSVLSKSIKSDPTYNDEVGQTFIKGIDSILSAVRKQHGNEIVQTIFKTINDLLSTASRKADPNDEMLQTAFNGFKTMVSFLGKEFVNGGKIQSSNCKMNQAFINHLSSFPSGVGKQIDNGEVQSDSVKDFMRVFLNVFKLVFSATRRNSNPNDEALQTFFNASDTLISLMARFFDDYDNERDESEVLLTKDMFKFFSQALSALAKRYGNSELAQSFFNGLSRILSAVGQKMINGGRQSQIQFSSELPGAVLNLLGNDGSFLKKKAGTKNEAAHEILFLFNTRAKNGIGGGQEVHVKLDTLPTYTAKRFDQSMSLKSVDENAVTVEDDMDLTAKAKTQLLWDAILSSFASSVLNG